MSHWKTLGLSPTLDRKIIKRAYHDLLKHNSPEDDASAFMAIREAYDAAIAEVKYKMAHQDTTSTNNTSDTLGAGKASYFNNFSSNDSAGKSADYDDDQVKEVSGQTPVDSEEQFGHLNELFESGIHPLVGKSKVEISYREQGTIIEGEELNLDVNALVEESLLLISAGNYDKREEAWRSILKRAEILSPLSKAEYVSSLSFLSKKYLSGCWLGKTNDPEGLSLVMEFLSKQFDGSTQMREQPWSKEQLESVAKLSDQYQSKRTGSFVHRVVNVFKSLTWLLFSLKGKIGRRVFMGAVVLMLSLPIIALETETLMSNNNHLFLTMLIAGLLSVVALSVKRMRDAGGPLWVLALAVIPMFFLVPMFWLFFIGPNIEPKQLVLQRRPLFYSLRGFQRRLQILLMVPDEVV
jgi:uncharacterized membrane protein YhaH (DUF805 family)|tara:strand:+ start:120 stop:1343 length:1224 start_codon:yes stop_codon:yes gene_type:complete